MTVLAVSTVSRQDAMKFYGRGHTAEGLRALAADPELTRGLALLSGITEDEERAEMLAIADAIDALAAEGLTPPDCWEQLGWSLDFVEALLTSEGGTARM